MLRFLQCFQRVVVMAVMLCAVVSAHATDCTNETGTILLPATETITPIPLATLLNNGVIKSYTGTGGNTIYDMQAYVEGEEWSVYFPSYNKIISGYAVCGPGGRATNEATEGSTSTKQLIAKNLTTNEAFDGCYCKLGEIVGTKDEGSTTNYASAKRYNKTYSAPADKIQECRANCPYYCANLVATKTSFRSALYGSTCPEGTPGEEPNTCDKSATDYCDVTSDCEYVLKSAYSVGYTMDSGDDYCIANPNEYSILLTLDGEDVMDEVIMVYYGSAISGLPVPTLDGMGFVGWFDENGNEYTNGTIYNVADDMILYAKWGCELPIGDAVTYRPTGSVDVMTLAQLRTDYPSDFSLDGNGQTKLNTENAMALYNRGQQFSVQYENGWIHGTAFCGPASSVTGKPRDQLTVYQAGRGCWCRYGTEDTKSATGFQWVGTKELKGDIDTVCRAECPSVCAEYTATNSSFRSNLLNEGVDGAKCPEMDKNAVQCDARDGFSVTYNTSTGECEYTVIKYAITLDSGEIIYVDIETPVEPITPPRRQNFKFGGYYTGESATGVMIYDENGNFVLETPEEKKEYLLKNQTLYAHWIDIPCTDNDGMVVWNGVDDVASTADLLASGVVSKKDSVDQYEYDVNDLDAYTSDQRWAVYFDEYGLVSGSAFCGPRGKATYGNAVKDIVTGTSGATVSQAYSGCWCRYGEPVPNAVWVAAADYRDQGNDWATRTDACRRDCPRACSDAIATDADFRRSLYEGDVCPVGSFDEPILCAPGYYMDNGTCTTCPDGYTSDPGSTAQNQCYQSCEAVCAIKKCPNNAICEEEYIRTPGKQYYGNTSCQGGTCEVNVTIICNHGYDLVNDTCNPTNYIISYNANGGESVASTTYTIEDTFTLPTPIRDGYTFIGWFDNGTQISEIVVGTTGDKTLVAQWELNTVTCMAGTYLPNGATVCTECMAGYYCTGGTFEIKNEVQGMELCPDGTVSEKGAAQCTVFVPEFSITTTPISAGTEFYFTLSAKGKYYIDWGDKTGIQAVNKTNVGPETIRHTYENSAAFYTIHMFGDASAYNTTDEPVIDFKGNEYVYELRGSLGAIFGGNTKFMFEHTFQDCKNLEVVTATLFNGVAGPVESMFNSTFQGCEKLAEIPSGLFDILGDESYGAARHMFMGTFNGCSALKYIPSDLFAKVTGGAYGLFKETFKNCVSLKNIDAKLFNNITTPDTYMFESTFQGCSSLTEIPEQLFQNISGGAESLFYSTFRNCTGLKEIKSGLFNSIDTNAPRVFDRTFYGCSSLTEIPDDLFSGITNTENASFMFVGTFENCTALSKLPTNLFANITGTPADSMFYMTFKGCTGLYGYLTPEIFAKLDMNGVKISDVMDEIFSGTNLDKKCQSGTRRVKANFGYTLSGRAVCLPCDAGQTSLSGADTCHVPRKLRISNGDNVDETISLMPVTPVGALTVAFDIYNDGVYYACLSTDSNRTINNNTTNKMHVLYQDTEYLMYDCTAQ